MGDPRAIIENRLDGKRREFPYFRDAAVIAVAAASSIASPYGRWHLIETAPMIEEDVLLWAGGIEIGYFSSFSGYWLSRDKRLANDRPRRLEPTHWMPLPGAPRASRLSEASDPCGLP